MKDAWVICITIDILPGFEAEFIRIVGQVIDEMRHEETFINTMLCQDERNQCRFFLYETWESREEFVEVQLMRPYRNEYIQRMKEIQSSERTFSEWRELRSDIRQRPRGESQDG